MESPRQSRSRTLAILAGATLAVLVLASLALMQRARDMGPSFEPQPVIPGLTESVNNIGEVMIETADESFHARRTPEGRWGIVERANFPANIAVVRSVAVGMAELQAIEPRTAQPELFGRLGLVAPEDGGEAMRVVLLNREGETIGDLLIGNTQDAPDPQGLNRIYVRRTGENQTWLARGSMTLQPDIGAWLDKDILAINPQNIRSSRFTPADGPAFTLSRESPEDREFSLEEIPQGRELSYPGVTYPPATALADFTFEDVRPIGEIDFTDASEIVTETFDGLIVTAQVVEAEGSHWVSLTAEAREIAAAPDAEVTEEEEAAQGVQTDIAAFIVLATHGWAFEIGEFDAQSLLTSRDSLLSPAGQ